MPSDYELTPEKLIARMSSACTQGYTIQLHMSHGKLVCTILQDGSRPKEGDTQISHQTDFEYITHLEHMHTGQAFTLGRAIDTALFLVEY